MLARHTSIYLSVTREEGAVVARILKSDIALNPSMRRRSTTLHYCREEKDTNPRARSGATCSLGHIHARRCVYIDSRTRAAGVLSSENSNRSDSAPMNRRKMTKYMNRVDRTCDKVATILTSTTGRAVRARSYDNEHQSTTWVFARDSKNETRCGTSSCVQTTYLTLVWPEALMPPVCFQAPLKITCHCPSAPPERSQLLSVLVWLLGEAAPRSQVKKLRTPQEPGLCGPPPRAVWCL